MIVAMILSSVTAGEAAVCLTSGPNQIMSWLAAFWKQFLACSGFTKANANIQSANCDDEMREGKKR